MTKVWQILHQSAPKDLDSILDVLLENRGLKSKKEKEDFFSPQEPNKISLKEFGISESEVKKAITRIKTAIKKKEKIIVYGDYDADGVCATAILWECLYSLKANVLPYIPERFSEGYGLNIESIKKLKEEDPELKLIITVDNGIVANDAVTEAKKLGVDVIITDHHEIGKKKPNALAVVHTTKIGGAGVSWVFAREISKKGDGLELCAIGTIADQIPLLGPNRSLVKYGLMELNKTKRPGINSLFEEAAIVKGAIGTYEVGFMIAPRINAMGRLRHAIDSLRLLCTKNALKAKELSQEVGRANKERQKILSEIVIATRTETKKLEGKKIIVVASETYHEGVIGLAAGRLVEEFYRPAIVFSKGEKYAKASARSVAGFNIIEAIRKVEDLLVAAGGHPMAAGFTIESGKILEFEKRLLLESNDLLTDEVLLRKLKIDMEIGFDKITPALLEKLQDFEPTGLGNQSPIFASKKVEVIDARGVGDAAKHLKLKLRQDGSVFSAIAFGFGGISKDLGLGAEVDIAYTPQINSWNGSKNIELRIRDIKV